MNKELNELLLRRKNKIMLVEGSSPEVTSKEHVVTLVKNMSSLGYTFSVKALSVLFTYTVDELIQFNEDIISLVKKLIGADVEYKPMYPNFPNSVMEMEEAELYINALVHYVSGGTLYPYEDEEERIPLTQFAELKVIDLGTEDDIKDIFKSLCLSKTSLSDTDKEDIRTIFRSGLAVKFPDNITYKENVALIGQLYVESSEKLNCKHMRKYFKTATDVLRLITLLSDGDISLAANTKYRNFSRKERRFLIGLLNECASTSNIDEDMLRYKNKWIKVGEKLHPGEDCYNCYKSAQMAFKKLRNNVHINTFNSKVEELCSRGQFMEAAALLKRRPGEFVRRLDYLLRRVSTDEERAQIIGYFRSVAPSISTPVLLQLREHFLHRDEDRRIIWTKKAKLYSMENTLEEIPEKYIKSVIQICENALVHLYSQRDYMGSVYLSDEFKNYKVPFNQRTATKALKNITRGSRVKLNDDSIKTLRGFIWWTDRDDSLDNWRVDIDLSAAICSENWDCLEHISYTNLKSPKFNGYHSGDITAGGDPDEDGVSEFLDIDIDSVLKNGGRYVVYQVYSFTGQKFADIPHVMFGWMKRANANSGEIYEPSTVEQKLDLASASIKVIPVIFDCKEREIIWCDTSISGDLCTMPNNVENNLQGIQLVCYSMVNMIKPSLYDLIDFNIRGRGIKVDKKEDADIIFDIEDADVTPYDIELFMADYL